MVRGVALLGVLAAAEGRPLAVVIEAGGGDVSAATRFALRPFREAASRGRS
eukprot:CAMPEP_0197397018 /NCGR_PEP_ID=MMETSP1165-20131217/10732_1 /TAXON_ID=284809 /ORGANISM="Chrysocystis fragilis, Strain CCMP3189" /LENGTH=50 /DNA_ID=CAMNT_0042922893 /DNA_START=1 /DNA_END=150 /DNA_ORIENTATION=+